MSKLRPTSELKKKRQIHVNDTRFVEKFDFEKASAESLKKLLKRPFYTT